jgi:hypothetical protein
MAAKRKGAGRPRKPEGTRVRDQLHIGLRFDGDTAEKLRVVIQRTNAHLRASGLPPVTAYGLVRHWIVERVNSEFEKE